MLDIEAVDYRIEPDKVRCRPPKKPQKLIENHNPCYHVAHFYDRVSLKFYTVNYDIRLYEAYNRKTEGVSDTNHVDFDQHP